MASLKVPLTYNLINKINTINAVKYGELHGLRDGYSYQLLFLLYL